MEKKHEENNNFWIWEYTNPKGKAITSIGQTADVHHYTQYRMKIITEHNPARNEIDFLKKKLFQYNRQQIDDYAYENFISKIL